MSTPIPRTDQEAFDAVSVGDFFECSWGYDQTNIDFYEVVAKTTARIKVRKVAARFVDAFDDRRLVPVAGAYTGEAKTKRVRAAGGYFRAAFYVASYANAYLWDGEPAYDTTAAGEAGH